jgi:hypothetical protein
MNDITNFCALFYFLLRRHFSLCLSKNVQSISARSIFINYYSSVHDLDLENRALTDRQKEIIDLTEKLTNSTPELDEKYCRRNLTSPNEVKMVIKKLPNNKAPGLDNITNRMVKNFTHKTVVQLHYIINATIKLQHFPSPWKRALVIPIRKPNKNTAAPENFRPISLLSGLSKVAEKIINNRIQKYDSKLRITQDEQFGFRSEHDTTQQISRIVTEVINNYNKDNVTQMTILDIQKAFDRVWVQGLIAKLMKTKLPINLIKLLLSYLTNRTLQVKVENAISHVKLIKAGVPQGSVLGPKLFTLYIHDIPKFEKTNLALYADDTAIYARSYYADVANKQVQIHMDKIEKYYSEWLININASKTESIIFTRKFTNNKIITKLRVKGEKIDPQPTVKYLGVHLDSRLNFKQHLGKTKAKAEAALKTLYPLMARRSKLNVENKTRIYKTIIRPIITYAAPVWCGVSDTALHCLQTLQNKCLRLATNSSPYTRISKLHNETETEMLREHLEKLSYNFYKYRLQHSRLTQNLTKIRRHNAQVHIRHKLPYMRLKIFEEQE